MPEATPRPWPAVGHNNDTGPSDDSYMEWWQIEGVARFYEEADAELARRAVNSHDALVAALERARSLISCAAYAGSGPSRNESEVIELIDAALAQAQGARQMKLTIIHQNGKVTQLDEVASVWISGVTKLEVVANGTDWHVRDAGRAMRDGEMVTELDSQEPTR